MEMTVKDGIGGGFSAGVSPSFRLLTAAVTQTIETAYGAIGTAYSIASPVMTLTAATASAVFYLAPTDQNAVCYVSDLRLCYGKSAAGNPGSARAIIYKNSTGGTLTSSPSGSITPVNRNFGSADLALATCYYGTEAKTLTGGTTIATLLSPDNAILTNQIGGWWVPAGTNIGVEITPPASNTSMTVTVTALVAFLDPDDLVGYNVG